MGRGREEETGTSSNVTLTLNGIDQTKSQIIIRLDRSSDVIKGRLPSRVGRRRRGRRGVVRRWRGGRGRGWGRRPTLGALEAVKRQKTEELTYELYVRRLN
jgi:hypothetical protein